MRARSRLRSSTVAQGAPCGGATRAREDWTIGRALRILEQRVRGPGPLLSEVATCGAFFRLRLGSEEREHFEAAFLNTRHQLIAVERLFSGTVDGAEVHPRIVVQTCRLPAFQCQAKLEVSVSWYWRNSAGVSPPRLS
ncbi:TPA: JAB domain-containing protein [Stenotrophomonas maltophilia]